MRCLGENLSCATLSLSNIEWSSQLAELFCIIIRKFDICMHKYWMQRINIGSKLHCVLFLLSHIAAHHLHLLHYHRLHHLLLLAQNFIRNSAALQQILSPIDLFLFYRTDYTDSRTMLIGCTGKCVRLSRPLVCFWTHFKSPHFHSFIHFIHFVSHKKHDTFQV